MGIYYIKTQDDVYFELDSTSEIQVVFSGQATDYPIENGNSVADHYINKPTQITFNGTISDIKPIRKASNSKTTKDYVDGLLKVKKSGTPFQINWAGNIDPIPNCVFESLTIEQNAQRGWNRGIAAYSITFTAKQIRLAEGAVLLDEPTEEMRLANASMSAGSGNTQAIRGGSNEDEVAASVLAREELMQAKKEWSQLVFGNLTEEEDN